MAVSRGVFDSFDFRFPTTQGAEADVELLKDRFCLVASVPGAGDREPLVSLLACLALGHAVSSQN
jgi:hypothetical protein